MDEPQSLDGELSQAMFVEMMRAGILPASVVERVMFDFQEQANAACSAEEKDRAQTLSRMTLEVLLQGDGADAEKPEVLYRREQIRKRTRYIERQANADGGNE